MKTIMKTTKLLTTALLALSAGGIAHAATLTWDEDPGTAGIQDGAGTWDTTTNNWYDGANNVLWPNTTADEAILGDGGSISNAQQINLDGGSITLNKLTFASMGGGYYRLLSGTLAFGGADPTITVTDNIARIDTSMTGSVTKDGAGALDLRGDNSGLSSFTVESGRVQVAGNTASLGGAGTTVTLGATTGSSDAEIRYFGGSRTLPTKSGIVVEAGSSGTKTLSFQSNGTFIENTAITLNDDVTIDHGSVAGTGIFTYGGNITGSGDLNLIGLSSGDLTFSGNISTTGGITKSGDYTAILTGTNTYTGATAVNAGTLEIGGSATIGDYQGGVSIASGATLIYSSDQNQSGSNRFRTGGISGDGTFVVDTTASVMSRQQVISVAKLEIKSGTLIGQANAGSLGNESTTVYLGDTTGSADAELQYSGSGGTFTTKANIIVQAGSTGIKKISNTPTVTDNTNITLNGDLTFAPIQHSNNDRSLTMGGVISGAGNLTLDAVSNGAGDPGILVLTGANTYSGNTTVTNGILQIGSAGKLESGSVGLYSGNISVAAGATFQYSSTQGGQAARYFGDISGAGTLIKDTAGNDLRLFGNTTISNIEINTGEIRGSSNVNSLGGAGTTIYLGDTTGGSNTRLRYGGTMGTLTTKAGIEVRAGSTGTRTIANDGVNTENTDILLNDDLIVLDNSAITLGGAISGSGGLTKYGAGSTTLTGVNSYGGTTTIDAGTLSLASGSSHSGSGAYTVNGGILEIATGVDLSGHDMTIAGVISPGNSPGTAATGAQTWLDGGSYLWEINNSGGTQGADSGWDWLDITGALDLTSLTAGGFTIDIDSLTLGNIAGDADGFGSYIQLDGIADYSFTIATATSISGFDDSLFTLDYSGFSNAPSWDWAIVESGNSLVLEAYAVPEPSSTALLGLGGLALMLRRKRS